MVANLRYGNPNQILKIGGLAQLVERLLCKQEVSGSTPLSSTIISWRQKMFTAFTAKYSKIDSGYMGQLVEWPEVVTEGADIEECRAMLKDALNEMILAYQQEKKEIPVNSFLLEQIPVEMDLVSLTA